MDTSLFHRLSYYVMDDIVDFMNISILDSVICIQLFPPFIIPGLEFFLKLNLVLQNRLYERNLESQNPRT